MRAIRALRRLSVLELGLLLEAGALLAGARVTLWILPYRHARRMFSGSGAARLAPPPDQREVAMTRVSQAVGRACRAVPAATCLTQALATRTMLARRGVRSTLRFGVATGEGAALDAHAWVESDGRIVVGRLRDMERFVPLPPSPDDAS